MGDLRSGKFGGRLVTGLLAAFRFMLRAKLALGAKLSIVLLGILMPRNLLFSKWLFRFLTSFSIELVPSLILGKLPLLVVPRYE